MQGLGNFRTMVIELRSTNSRNEKMLILRKYPENKDLLQIVLDPFKKFNVTKKSILKYTLNSIDLSKTNSQPQIESTSELIEFLNKLSSRETSGNDALACCDYIIRTVPTGYEDILLNIFNKNLEIRIGDKEVNKVWPGLIPTYNVCLAQKATNKLLAKVRTEPDMWVIMRKLDGLRCVAEYERTTAESICKSRNGNVFTSLVRVNNAVEEMMLKLETDTSLLTSVAFDGEICVVDSEGNEDFSKAVSEVKRKNQEMKHPKYVIFDAVPLDDFRDKYSGYEYTTRIKNLKNYINYQKSPYLGMIDVVKFSEENFEVMKQMCAKEGWEGLMLRRNVAYEGKRTKDLLKVKEFFTEEFEVQGWTHGPFRAISDETGLEETIQTLTSVKIRYQNNIVEVGSGFTLVQRKEFFDDPNKIVGKVITVQYFEVSHNKQGGTSLRFPTVKHIWGNKRDV